MTTPAKPGRRPEDPAVKAKRSMSTPNGPRRLLLGSCPGSWGVWFADGPRQTSWPRFLDELTVVEQDMYPCDFSMPEPIAERTFRYLNANGLGGTA